MVGYGNLLVLGNVVPGGSWWNRRTWYFMAAVGCGDLVYLVAVVGYGDLVYLLAVVEYGDFVYLGGSGGIWVLGIFGGSGGIWGLGIFGGSGRIWVLGTWWQLVGYDYRYMVGYGMGTWYLVAVMGCDLVQMKACLPRGSCCRIDFYVEM